jgi:hypothetical protein
MTKALVLASHRDSKLKYDSIKHFDIQTHIYGNTVVLTGQSLSMVHSATRCSISREGSPT